MLKLPGQRTMQGRVGEPHRSGGGSYIKSFVYGGLDGTITTFAVVAGVAGASLSSNVILILGFANLIADGIAMAFGDILSTRAEQQYQAAERALHGEGDFRGGFQYLGRDPGKVPRFHGRCDDGR